MSCKSADGKELCHDGYQTRAEGNEIVTVPCIMCNTVEWAKRFENWQVPKVEKAAPAPAPHPAPKPPAETQEALFDTRKENSAYAD